MGPPRLPCDSSVTESGSDDEDPTPEALVDTAPAELVGADHPLFGTDIEGLTHSDAAWMRQQFLDFYSENTRLSMEAKFARFQRFCEDNDLRAFPAHPSSIYRYVRFLRDEGQISVHSLPQYLAAISMVHQSRGYLAFSAFDGVTRRLTLAWRRAAPARPSSASPVAVAVIFRILDLGLSTSDTRTLRACTSAVLDFVFFNRAVSGHLLLLGDVTIADDVIVFRERRTKGSRGAVPGERVRSCPTLGVPSLPALFARWHAAHQSAWASRPSPDAHFWALPGEAAPTARTISTWFATLLGAHPDLSPAIRHRHHDLRAGGATACFALEVPEPHIRAWGGWSARGGAFWKYIDVDRQPTEGDFRVFGWMTLRARDLHARFAHIFLP